MIIVESFPTAACKAGVLSSRREEGPNVLGRGLVVQMFGGVPATTQNIM